MAATTINPRLVDIALGSTNGLLFERFVFEFYAGLMGADFVPLGGMKDGGADAFLGEAPREGGKAQTFYQASIQADFRAKIRDTVDRLREFGRDPKQLTYLTSKQIPYIDVEEERLTEELEVTIRIRDKQYIAAHINSNSHTLAAFRNHLYPELKFLESPGNVPIIPKTAHVVSPAAYVFLRQEIEHRSGARTLREAVCDSLILWALEGTDPDKKRFLNRSNILNKIISTIPPSKHFVPKIIDSRLKFLTNKNNPSGREVRWHKKEDNFCLPYETRKIVEQENIEDESLRLDVIETLKRRITEQNDNTLSPEEIEEAAKIAVRAVQITFEREGLQFSAFLNNNESSDSQVYISDNIDVSLREFGISGERSNSFKALILHALRGSFYQSEETERIYFSKLSRTYSLLFSLNADPRIIEYLQGMAGDFVLYVGSDILIRAISERFLKHEDQMTRNMLAMIADAGATLVLCEPVLDEVVAHLRGTDFEFRNYFSATERAIDTLIASQSPKILIRAYFYAKLDPERHTAEPTSWRSYVRQFCDYDELHKVGAKNEIRDYLLSQFHMTFDTIEELESFVDSMEVKELAEELMLVKRERKLAINDATIVHAIYGRRRILRELSEVTGYGFRTWWLTGEVTILSFTKGLVKKNSGARYMMRPEFLLNFIALSPTTAEVREAYKNIFPTLLGIKLSSRMRESVFQKQMKDMNEAKQMDEGRVKAIAAKLSNQLKSDFGKIYDREF